MEIFYTIDDDVDDIIPTAITLLTFFYRYEGMVQLLFATRLITYIHSLSPRRRKEI